MLLTGETPSLGPNRYLPARLVCGGTTMPTKVGSKHSDGMFPEVLADEEDELLLLKVFDLLLEHDREELPPSDEAGSVTGPPGTELERFLRFIFSS